MIARLFRTGLAAAEREVVMTGCKEIEVIRVGISRGAEGDRGMMETA
jgi:hypothetical protein